MQIIIIKKFFAVIVAAFAVILSGYAATAADSAAEQGHADVQYLLGLSYFFGEGVTKDYAEAVKWFRKAAQQGNQEAKKALNDLGKTW